MSDTNIFYLCDGKNPSCTCKEFCGCLHENAIDVCFHTTNPDYAINGPLKKSPIETNADITDTRPLFISDENGYFWEGFIGKGSREVYAVYVISRE